MNQKICSAFHYPAAVFIWKKTNKKKTRLSMTHEKYHEEVVNRKVLNYCWYAFYKPIWLRQESIRHATVKGKKHFPHSKRLHSLSFDKFPLNINHMTIKHFLRQSVYGIFASNRLSYLALSFTSDHLIRKITAMNIMNSLQFGHIYKKKNKKEQKLQFVGMYRNSRDSPWNKTGLAKLNSTSFRHVSQQ